MLKDTTGLNKHYQEQGVPIKSWQRLMAVSHILNLKGIYKENIPSLEEIRRSGQNNKFNIVILPTRFRSCIKDLNKEKQDFLTVKKKGFAFVSFCPSN